MAYFSQIQPLYTIFYYTDFLYRVVKFKRSSVGLADRTQKETSGDRFLQSYSRSRSRVLQYALCNHWDYFITITVSPELFDRYTLGPIYSALSDFFKFYRKHFSSDFRYLLVPEFHKDDAWHFHGLVAGVLPSHLTKFIRGIHPQKLVDADYDNWGMLANVIGYLSLSEVKSPVGCGFYIAKYITKEHSHDDFYEHLYYHSRGLKTAYPVSDCYTFDPDLERYCDHDYDFCSCGWVKFDTPDFTFPISGAREPRELGDFSRFESDLLDSLASDCPDEPFDPVQLTLQEWEQIKFLFN